MRVLAISFCLPPGSVPQAVQIGRLLAKLPAKIGVVCGEPYPRGPNEEISDEFNQRLTFRQDIAFRPFLSGFTAALARRFVPFWGRIPDEFRRWVRLAEEAALTRLQTEKFQPDLIATFGEPMSDHLVGLTVARSPSSACRSRARMTGSRAASALSASSGGAEPVMSASTIDTTARCKARTAGSSAHSPGRREMARAARWHRRHPRARRAPPTVRRRASFTSSFARLAFGCDA